MTFATPRPRLTRPTPRRPQAAPHVRKTRAARRPRDEHRIHASGSTAPASAAQTVTDPVMEKRRPIDALGQVWRSSEGPLRRWMTR